MSDFNSPVTLAATGNPAPTTATFCAESGADAAGLEHAHDRQYRPASPQARIRSRSTAPRPAPTRKTTNVTLDVFATAPGAPTLTGPSNGATNVPIASDVHVDRQQRRQLHDRRRDRFVVHEHRVHRHGQPARATTPNTDLQSNTQFFWRVTAANTCGTGARLGDVLVHDAGAGGRLLGRHHAADALLVRLRIRPQRLDARQRQHGQHVGRQHVQRAQRRRIRGTRSIRRCDQRSALRVAVDRAADGPGSGDAAVLAQARHRAAGCDRLLRRRHPRDLDQRRFELDAARRARSPDRSVRRPRLEPVRESAGGPDRPGAA